MTSPAQAAINAHGKVWIGSPKDIRLGDIATNALENTNDTRFWDNSCGITRIPYSRWLLAQLFEEETWNHNKHLTEDRNQEHQIFFDNYRDLPMRLGKVIEFGCGPFTQLKTIIQGRTAESVTLLDPLIQTYLSHPNCAYKDGKFGNFDTTLIDYKAEWPTVALRCRKPTRLTAEEFDVCVCINVLEHVENALDVLSSLLMCLRPGGYLVFADRFYDGLEIDKIYDVGHPIRVKRCVLEDAFRNYNSIMSKICDGDCLYFIGTKKYITQV